MSGSLIIGAVNAGKLTPREGALLLELRRDLHQRNRFTRWLRRCWRRLKGTR